MKKISIITILIILITLNLTAQEKLLDIFPLKDGKVTYVGVVEIEGVTQKELHKRANFWFAKTYKSSQDVIQMDTEEQIISKGFYTIRAGGSGLGGYEMQVWNTLTIQFKDGKYRYIVEDFIGKNEQWDLLIELWNGTWNEKIRNKRNAKVYPEVNEGMLNILASLKKEMSETINDDW